VPTLTCGLLRENFSFPIFKSLVKSNTRELV
jgi:hypothetical protein